MRRPRRRSRRRRPATPLVLALLHGCAAQEVAEPSRLLALFQAGSAAELSCEADAQWSELRTRLLWQLQHLGDTRSLDLTRAVHLLTKGIGPSDLDRCPVGAAAVQLFLQLALASADPAAALQVIRMEPWPAGLDEPWRDISLAPWPALFTSRWPFFELLALLRELLLEAGGATPGACTQLWEELPDERKVDFLKAGSNVSRAARVALDLPPGACAAARAAAAVALAAAAATPAGPVEAQLLEFARGEASERWPRELLLSPWPALTLLTAMERRAAPVVAQEGLPELRGVIAYIHFRPGEMPRFHDVERSIASVERYWLDAVPDRWPVIVFADAATAPSQAARLQGQFPKLDVQVAAIDDRDLNWPVPHEHPFCSRGYRRAARLTAGPLYLHRALDGFTHLMLLDTEFELTHPVPFDPFRHLHAQRSQLAYWQTHYERTWNRTLYLTEVSREFMVARGLQPQVPELVQYWWDYDEGKGGSFPVNIYGCIFAGAMSFFRSELFQEYFRELDSWPGWDEHCWSPQSVLAIAAGFFLGDAELTELWVYGRHQNSTKTPDEGWNLSHKGLLPEGLRRSQPSAAA
uniref:Uncharacterized protein n=1 Tax=Alexandrium monilatum TaxID=311494 RepID=A0A7S4RC71_9DINO